jgi:hypothetical protein
MAITIEVVVELQAKTEREWTEVAGEGDWYLMRTIAQWEAYLNITYCHSLRG